MAEGARLESVYTATYRGFESPPHRHIYEKSPYASTGSFLCNTGPGDEKPRPGFDHWRSQGDGMAEGHDARRASAASQSPPHRHISEKSPYASTGFFLCSTGPGDEKPRRGSTTGAARGTEWPQAMTPEGRAQRVNPPLTAILLKRARTQVRAFFFAIPDRGMRSPDQITHVVRPFSPCQTATHQRHASSGIVTLSML